MILESNLIDPHHQCVAKYTKDNDGKFLCGENKDPALSYPKLPNSITAGMLGLCIFVPWFLTSLLNMITMKCYDLQFTLKTVLKNNEILLRMILFACSATEVSYIYGVSLHIVYCIFGMYSI